MTRDFAEERLNELKDKNDHMFMNYSIHEYSKANPKLLQINNNAILENALQLKRIADALETLVNDGVVLIPPQEGTEEQE